MGIVASNNNDPRVRRLVAGPELRRAWLPAAALHGGMSVHAGSAVLRLLRAVFGPFSAVPGVGLRAFAALRGGSVALAVACSLLLSGCSKDRAGVSDPDVPTDAVTVGFRPGTLTVAGSSGGNGGWNTRSAKGVASSLRSAGPDAATRADVPPALDSGPGVDNPDDLPVGTTFRVLVYEAGADPQTDSPVAENTYKVSDDQGTIVSTAVDGKGNAIEGDTREIVLRRGAYDFYYFSPAVAASTSMPNPGTYMGLTNGADYMALVQRQEIDPSQGTKHYIPEVCFYRMGSYIDIRISPREGEVMGTLEVTGEGLQLWGLPAKARYEVGEYPYRLTVEGEGGLVDFAPARFTNETGTTVSTVGCSGGLAVLPGYASELTVKVTLTSDGKELKLDASLPGYVFEPGYRYVVELGVGRIADKPELDVEILPWDEYDWGEGEIGGGYLRSATVSPDGDIPGGGGAYGITLEGFLPSSGVEVRARVDGQTEPLVSGKVTASGTAVELTIPANTGVERTVVFEYKWGDEWKSIVERTWKSRIGELYGGGVVYLVSGSDFRVVALDESTLAWAASKSYVLGDGARDQTARNGADVWKLALASSEGKLSGESGVFATDYPAFDYCYNKTDGNVPKGTWYLPSIMELRYLYSAKGSIESVITANGGTVFSTGRYWSATEYSTISSGARDVNFSNGNTSNYYKPTSYYVRCIRGKGEVEPYVSSAAVSPDGDIPGGGGAYGITLKGLLPSDGVEVRANISGADPVTGKATTSGTPVELNIPVNTTGAERTVVFEYKWNGTWTKIAERSQEKQLSVGDLYGGGVVYWVSGSDFRVVALDQTSSTLKWAASTDYVLGSGAQGQTARNGADVWQIAKQYSDNMTDGASGTFATDFPAFSYCYEKTDGGVAKGTWYLPSKQELKDLYSAKGSVETVITANNGTAFSADGYWSATETSGNSRSAWAVNFSNGSAGSYTKTASRYVRCVRDK